MSYYPQDQSESLERVNIDPLRLVELGKNDRHQELEEGVLTIQLANRIIQAEVVDEHLLATLPANRRFGSSFTRPPAPAHTVVTDDELAVQQMISGDDRLGLRNTEDLGKIVEGVNDMHRTFESEEFREMDAAYNIPEPMEPAPVDDQLARQREARALRDQAFSGLPDPDITSVLRDVA